MFSKKFFSTVALSGATVSLVQNVGDVFAKKISSVYSSRLLTCKVGGIDSAALEDKNSYFYKDTSWSLQKLVKFFHLDRSETEKLLCIIRAFEDRRSPLFHKQVGGLPSGEQQIIVGRYPDDSIEVTKATKGRFFNIAVVGGKRQWWSVHFDWKDAEKMLKTDLDTIDFSNCKPRP